MSIRAYLAVAAGVLAVVVAGCGGGSQQSSGGQQQPSGTPANPNQAETNPAGDIPDNQAYVPYRLPGGGVTVKVPEGWGRTAAGRAVVFSDKLNAVRIETRPAHGALSVSAAKRSDVRALARSVKGFSLRGVTTVSRKAGTAVRISYLAKAPPNPVTGKAVTDAVERYVFFHNGKAAVLTLSGPKRADNVDPWRIISNSLRWTP
jgi:hypothetical protein